MESLPYKSKVITVSKDMCDHNGHMNVNYYYKMFDNCYTDMYINDLDFTQEYIESGFSTFTLEDSIRYLKEFKLNDKVYPSFHLYNTNKKLLHFVGILLNESSELSAIFETVLGHIDLNARKITDFNKDRLANLLNYKNSNVINKELPFDVKLGIKSL